MGEYMRSQYDRIETAEGIQKEVEATGINVGNYSCSMEAPKGIREKTVRGCEYEPSTKTLFHCATGRAVGKVVRGKIQWFKGYSKKSLKSFNNG